MRKDCEDPIKAGLPALIVTHGNTTRKHRLLDQDILVFGRASACDVGLSSPEIAPVHCVILRKDDSWLLRDCSGGRFATRINGRTVHEEILQHSDILQIGAFSFEVHLPDSHATPAPSSTPVVEDRPSAALVQRLQRSRRNLVRLALKMRQRVHKSRHVPPALAELERQAECLRGLQRDYDVLVKEYESRLAELEQAEREVCDERAAFERECIERQTRLDKAEHDRTRSQAEMEAQLKTRWEECQERCRQSEQRHALSLQALPTANSDAPAPLPSELAIVLDRRSQELNHFARYLRRCRQQRLEPATPCAASDPEHLRQLDAARAQAQAEAANWQEQCQALQAEFTALEAQAQQRDAELTAERDQARLEADTIASTVQELQGISESLRREIHDREVVLEKLRRQLDQQSSQVNLEHSGSYERELNNFRLELERDRQELNEQICQLQVRQAEMEAAAREAELQMSRDRAVIARERAELTRLRDEIRMVKDRAARESGLRDRLANIHRLKQELSATTQKAAVTR